LRHGDLLEREERHFCADEMSFKKEEPNACLALGELV
jgi:hypothetical protein